MLGCGEPEHEILRETPGVARDCLVEAPGRHTVDHREIVIEDHAVSAQDEDRAGDVLDGARGPRWGEETMGKLPC